jgi:F0F1-type ATP synthase assembly protein I
MAEKKSAPATQDEKSEMVFTKKNYQLLLISIAIVVVGFILMIGTTGDIYDTRRTLIAPMVVLFGFGFGIYAILKK